MMELRGEPADRALRREVDVVHRPVLAAEEPNPRARLAAEVLASAAYASTAARVAAFVQQGGGCRATFFNYRRRLQGS